MEHPKQLPGEVDGPVVLPAEVINPSPMRYSGYGPSPFNSGEDDSSKELLKYLNILYKRKWLVVIASVAGLILSLLFCIYQTPVYQGLTTLEIQGIQDGSLDGRSSSPIQALSDIETQIALLQSRTMLDRVLTKMTPEQTTETLPVEPNKTTESAWRRYFLLPGTPTRMDAVIMAAGTVKVLNGKDTRVLNIFVDSTDPQVAADFANKLAEEYIQQNVEERWNAYQRTGEWLDRAQDELRVKLQQSEEKLQAYARASGILLTSEHDSVEVEKLRQVQAELSRAQSDRIAKQSLFAATTSGKGATSPDVLDSGPLRQYQVQLAELRRQMADLTTSLTPAHPKVKRIKAQIEELESTLAKERSDIVERTRSEYQAALRRESLLASDFAGQSAAVSHQSEKLIQYNILKREVDTNQQLFESTLQKGKEASIASALKTTNARIVDQAWPPPKPSKPNYPRNLALGLLAGIFMGVAYVIAKEFLNRSVQVPGDTPAFLNVPELGVIPSASSDPSSRRMPSRVTRLLPFRAGRGGPDKLGDPFAGNEFPRVELVTRQDKRSSLAESFRATLASILFSQRDQQRSLVIVVTSSSPGEGKTTVISNLAIALAEIKQKILLIDADIRKPKLNEIFGRSNRWGLMNVMMESTPIAQYPSETLFRKTDVPSLFLMTSGSISESVPSLLSSARPSQLLERARREFEVILLDTPPVQQLSDARAVGRLADGVIMVVRAGKTTQEAVLAAIQRFQQDGATILGTVLNDWNPKSSGHSYYSRDYAQGYRYTAS
jgi:polysaccharide biosynthesis transport protein